MAWYDALDDWMKERAPEWGAIDIKNREKLYSKLIDGLAPGDAELTKVLCDALSDSNNGVPIAATLMLRVAENLEEFKDLPDGRLKAISVNLAAGKIERDDIALLCAGYLASQQPDGPTRRLFKAIAQGKFNNANVLKKLLEYAENEVSAAAKKAIEKRLRDQSDFSIESLVLLFAAAVFKDGTITALDDDELVKEFLDSVTKFAPGSVGHGLIQALLQALEDDNPVVLLRAFAEAAGVGVDQGVIKALIAGEFESVVRGELRKAVERALVGEGVDEKHAPVLMDFFVRLIRGDVTLIPESEQKDLRLTDQQYIIYCRTRVVVALASVSLKNNIGIPTSRAGGLVAITTSSITADRLLKDLVGGVDQFPAFAHKIKHFTRAEFGQEITSSDFKSKSWPLPANKATGKVATLFSLALNVMGGLKRT